MSINRNKKFLVFSGGGAAGPYAFGGAIDELDKIPDFSFQKIEATAGTSIGSIAALMVAMNYTPKEIFAKMASIDLKKLADGGSSISEAYRLSNRYGKFEGSVLYKIINDIVEAKTKNLIEDETIKDSKKKKYKKSDQITFNDLKKLGCKDLYVVTTMMYLSDGVATGKEKIFSTNKHFDTPVAPIILASAAAPYYFPSLLLKRMGPGKYIVHPQGHLFTDGGIVQNLALNIFDKLATNEVAEQEGNSNSKSIKVSNPDTLAIAVYSPPVKPEINHKPVKTPIGYGHPVYFIEALINAFAANVSHDELEEKENAYRTIRIDRLNVSLAQFNIDQAKKEALVEEGRKAVRDFFGITIEPSIKIKEGETEIPQVSPAENFANKKVEVGTLWQATTPTTHSANSIASSITQPQDMQMVLVDPGKPPHAESISRCTIV